MKRKFTFLSAFVLTSLLVCFSFCSSRNDDNALLLKVKSIRGSVESGEMVLILQEDRGERILPLSVGGDQALAIHLGQQHVITPRPMTHDLIANIFKSLEIRVERITITDLKGGTYYAEIMLHTGGKSHRIDARPSDAIALSLRVDAPIYAMPHLLINYSPESGSPPDLAASPATGSAWGMTVQALTPALAEFFGEKNGVLIASVTPQGPAEKGGLQPGDVLTAVAQARVQSLSDFMAALAKHDSSTSMTLAYRREGRQLTATIRK